MSKPTICSSARQYVDQLSDLLAKMDVRTVDRVTDLLFLAYRENRQVFVLGNGGSASTASHHVLDYVKTAAVDGRRRLRAFCLSDNIGFTTALANDIGYEATFIYPLESYSAAGDVVVAISGSGNSPNVVKACEWAKANGLVLVALTGFSGGVIGPMADVHVHVPSDNYGMIEDLHLAIGHMVAQSLKKRVMAESQT